MARGPSRGRAGSAAADFPSEPQGDRRDGDRGPERNNPPALNIVELEHRTRDALIDFAMALDIENAAALPKPELVYRSLQHQAERQGNIYSGGVLSVVDDGFGFVRGERLIPGPNDVYVSQSQIRRFGLRNGDYVTGQVRQPKDSEKYYGLLRVETVNGLDPEDAK